MPPLKKFNGTKEASRFLKSGCVLAIGNYDGVHFGHRHILKHIVKKARQHKLKSVLLTFEPHPVKILSPDVSPSLINTLEQKLELLQSVGLDAVVVQKFDLTFAKITPESFFKNHLLKNLHAKSIAVGYDFTFGAKRSGTIETLEMLCYEHHVDLEIVAAKMLDDTLVSSTLIRKLIARGDVALANKLLERNFFIDGHIVTGHHRGTELGIHTANLETKNELIPLDGVYATRLRVGKKIFDSVSNIGFNPTFNNQKRSIETHIFDFDRKIYDQSVRLYFVDRLRDEIKFANAGALVKQIQKDISHAKKILKT